MNKGLSSSYWHGLDLHPLFPNAGIRRKTVFFHSLVLHSVLLSSEPSLSFCFWCFYCTLTSYTSQDQGNDDAFKSSSCLNLFVRLGSKLLARNCFLHGSFGFSEWMNEWCIYIVPYCVLLYVYMHHEGGFSPQPPPVCSIHLDDATAVTEQRHQYAHHTPATGGERESHRANQVYALTTHQLQVERERVIEPIKCMRSPHTSYRWRERES